MSNTNLWDRLGRTDPVHTKPFQRAGGFKGTAIKPMWSYRKMTEEFGPCGEGWGIHEPSFQVLPGADGEVLVYCTVSIWYGPAPVRVVYGVGGDKVISKFSSGLKSDDEAFKKAFTDAITNALKMIGVGADVHMGLFDDSKYVNELKQEIAEKAAPEPKIVSLTERNEYMVECREIIASFDDPELLGTWWKSDAQKNARREYQLDGSQIDTLKTAVIDRRNVLIKKAA